MNGISFNMANYNARQTGWNNTAGWGHGERTSVEYFQPIKTFGERFEGYLLEIKGMGFDAVDMWTGIMAPGWITPEHVEIAQDTLKRQSVKVYSYGGWMGANEDELVATCELAAALGATHLGGSTDMLHKDREFLVATLQKYGLRLGIENHPESPEEILAKIGDGGEGTIGATVDTGWFGTQGIDAAEAIRRLAPHLMLVHMKDVLAAGTHDTCRFGQGVVPLERCVAVLKDLGYSGTLSVEHEPELFDPTEDIVASLQMLKGWLA